jgi:lysophospholipase L1-like esterase
MKKLLTAVFASAVFSLAAADIHMAGDSTMMTYRGKDAPQHGWGQRMQELVKDGVKVYNRSIGGRSTKNFKAEGRWEGLLSEVRKGDFVIIQFGHNDGTKDKPERYTDPKTEYKENMKRFVEDVRKAGGIPVIVTSIPFGIYLEDGSLKPAGFLNPYLQSAREVAVETECDLVDLYAYADKELNAAGEKKGTQLYLVLNPGDYPNFPEGKSDRCHINFRGALFYAKAFALLAKRNKLPIAEVFKESDVSPMDAALSAQDVYIVRKDEAKDKAKDEAKDKAGEAKPETAEKP